MANDKPLEEVIRLFKYLLLKAYNHLADIDLVEKTKTDITFRYFLDYDPLDMDLVDIATLQRFRRQEISLESEECIRTVLGLVGKNLESEDILSSIKREVGYIDEASKDMDNMTLEEVEDYCKDRLTSIYKLENLKGEEINENIRYLQEIISDINAMNHDEVKFTLQTIAYAFLNDKIESF